MKRAMTVAGSDSCGGAGIQADLKTFSAFGVYGMSAVTAVTAQNTRCVEGVVGMDPEFVRRQIRSALSDLGTDGLKTGMLFNGPTVHAVACELRNERIPWIVVDPVLSAKDGSSLLDAQALDMLKRELLPLASLVTPNLEEAGALAGIDVRGEPEMEKAARIIQTLGPSAVLVKGGHLEAEPVDLLFDGEDVIRFPGTRIGGRPAHGTGCTLSAAVLACCVLGHALPDAVRMAKAYVEAAIRNAPAFGRGALVLNHTARGPEDSR
jgi:hydroxymethylpyrimidine/phosphomethylpyrimidine kinase